MLPLSRQRSLGAAVLVAAPLACFTPNETNVSDTDGSTGDGATTQSSATSVSGSTSATQGTTTQGTTTQGTTTQGTTTQGTTQSTTDSTSTTDDTQTTGTPTCDGTCLAEVPEGWTGPLAVWRGDAASAPACVGDYSQDAGAFSTDLVEGAATCQCSCGEATGIQCTTSVNLCYNGGGTGCLQFCIDPPSIAPGVCSSSGATNSHVSIGDPTPTNAGSCAASNEHEIEAPSFDTSVQACSASDTTSVGCEMDEVCVADVADPFTAMCILQSGDVDCPTGPFSEKTLLHSGVEDSRACSDCSCGAADSTCGGQVTFADPFQTMQCALAGNSVAVGQCAPHGGSAQAIYSPDPSGTCEPAGGVLSGEVTPTGAATLCCVPES